MAFRFEKLTIKSQEAVQKAQELARARGHQLDSCRGVAVSGSRRVAREVLAAAGR